MTGTIRTIRADKGFGFIKDQGGKEYFFHRSAVQGEGLEDLREGTVSSSTSAKGRKGLAPRTFVGHRPSATLRAKDGDSTHAAANGAARGSVSVDCDLPRLPRLQSRPALVMFD